MLDAHSEVEIPEIQVEKGKIFLCAVFCNFLDTISSFGHKIEKFCNKNLFLNLFSSVLMVSQILECMLLNEVA